MATRISLLALAALLGTGCITSPEPRESTPLISPPAPRPFDPSGFAAQFTRPQDCEAGARDLRAKSPGHAWAALKACVRMSRFIQLQTIVDGWVQDLQTRPDAPLLLTQVIAMRGGSVETDLQLLHKDKVPLFSLEDAFAQPEVYAGRYVVLRAKVDETRVSGNLATARVAEVQLQSESFEAPLAGKVHHRSTESHATGRVKGKGILGGPSAAGGYDHSTDVSSSESLRRYENVSVETGRAALLKLSKPDPFLESGREYIVIARFDGMRTTSINEDEDEPEQIATLTLVSYEEPNPLVMY